MANKGVHLNNTKNKRLMIAQMGGGLQIDWWLTLTGQKTRTTKPSGSHKQQDWECLINWRVFIRRANSERRPTNTHWTMWFKT
jgi:hypothetical protein